MARKCYNLIPQTYTIDHEEKIERLQPNGSNDIPSNPIFSAQAHVFFEECKY